VAVSALQVGLSHFELCDEDGESMAEARLRGAINCIVENNKLAEGSVPTAAFVNGDIFWMA